jgi:dTDP-4-dehydrorhamnose 3,5-epimerase
VIIRTQRFKDERGYFTELFKASDLSDLRDGLGIKDLKFLQANESCSHRGVIRGLHFQWDPYMGKLVRVIKGRVVELVLDIRKKSPTLGKLIMYELFFDPEEAFQEWIWVPYGFAHGNYFTEESMIEYFCTSEWNPRNEAGISPLSKDIDYGMANNKLKEEFLNLINNDNPVMSNKDRNAHSLGSWLEDPRSEVFGKEFV